MILKISFAFRINVLKVKLIFFIAGIDRYLITNNFHCSISNMVHYSNGSLTFGQVHVHLVVIDIIEALKKPENLFYFPGKENTLKVKCSCAYRNH